MTVILQLQILPEEYFAVYKCSNTHLAFRAYSDGIQFRQGGFAKVLSSRWGYFFCPPRTQTSAQASSATANLPIPNPSRSHRKTTQLPVEIAEGSISIAAGAYRTAGDVSMIDSLEIFRYMYFAFRQACTNDKCYDKTAHAQTGPHWWETAFGGNLSVLRRACESKLFLCF